MSGFQNEIQTLINKYSKENDNDTPDFILAEYLQSSLDNYSKTVKARDKWFNVDMWNKDKKEQNNFQNAVNEEMQKLNKE